MWPFRSKQKTLTITGTLPKVTEVRRWTKQHADSLKTFIQSVTGQALLERLHGSEYALALSGAADVMHTAHSAGVTKGYSDAIKHLISLSSVSEDSETPTSARVGDPLADEQTALTERFSP